jgi:hypothetical protein
MEILNKADSRSCSGLADAIHSHTKLLLTYRLEECIIWQMLVMQRLTKLAEAASSPAEIGRRCYVTLAEIGRIY